jgi:hypothetical protein
VARVGFGFDSLIAVASGPAPLWRLHHGERAERATLRSPTAVEVRIPVALH